MRWNVYKNILMIENFLDIQNILKLSILTSMISNNLSKDKSRLPLPLHSKTLPQNFKPSDILTICAITQHISFSLIFEKLSFIEDKIKRAKKRKNVKHDMLCHIML